MAKPSPSKYWRLASQSKDASAIDCSGQALPIAAVQSLRPRHGVLLAEWEPSTQLGRVRRLGIVRSIVGNGSCAAIDWAECEIGLRPNPAGRRWWTQSKPFFGFAPDVAARYGLDDLFAEHFPEFSDLTFGPAPKASSHDAGPSASPTGGYIYVVRSPHGFKIGKTVNLKQRTKLFEVKLPFKNSLEHYAWFDDYTHAERSFHRRFHHKRLEGEWFDLQPDDLEAIKCEGKHIPLEGLR
ncbi:hypothetical protein GCM10027034_09740 [Ramlibacter solisilvae]|uniref:GIY-YIG domain-containing protein n=1 Tax=Ramlibacter tataouinensis TaxID=94132 RepID=A0A127JXP5_9BURK|nr:GIY-YIG nuclease family protein [Ramlibacter tataouinensis]AMO24691.1 hypothetical protein UC35_19945 [Ramlibacter tataouinensis]